LFRRKKAPVAPPDSLSSLPAWTRTLPPLSLAVEQTAIKLRKADHPYASHTGDKMQFEGFELFDGTGAFRDPDSIDRVLKLQDGVWLARLAGIKQHLSPGHYATIVPLTKLGLRAEPSNPKDPHAVAVCTDDGVRAGFLPAPLAAEVCQLVSQGKGSAIVLGVYRLGERPVGVRLFVTFKNIALDVVLPD
jgi:hypothetical protein